MKLKHNPGSLDELCHAIRTYYPDAPMDLVKEAWTFANDAHSGQLRASGDPYIIHPTEVAILLAGMKLDVPSIITGLLHDTVEDTDVTLEEISAKFGKDVAELVDGVTKLSKITFKTNAEKQAENFRKMIVAMARDIRVILVKLADRLNNMRTLGNLPEPKQKIIAQETLDIYAPLANRLGIGAVKMELEDLCLRYLHPESYYKLRELVARKKGEREKIIEEICQILEEKLKEYDMQAQVQGRAKHFYSIFKKMERRNVSFDEIHDLIAFRIQVDNITECYKAIGVIHSVFKPIPGRFKDYIAMPKANSYQSLHTTVIGPHGERIEIQVRTHDMHAIADGGIAAHWQYKEGRFDSRSRENVEWVNRLLEWQKDVKDPNEFLETVKIDLFAEDVFVFTPKGEVRQLPHGSTPLDFAYAIHTDVGNHCVGAKINGKIVPLKYRLKSGDTLEVETSPTQFPSKDWLKIVKSSRAKTKIRSYIKEQERIKARDIGQNLLEKEFKRFGFTLNRLEKSGVLLKAAELLGIRAVEELYITVGYGKTPALLVVEKTIPKEEYDAKIKSAEASEQNPETMLKKIFKAATKRSEGKSAIKVANIHDVLIRMAKCCDPLPGDAIVGFITRGRGVTVHNASCAKAHDLASERRVEVAWNLGVESKINLRARIRVLSNDEPGLLALMSQTISQSGLNITSANVRVTKDRKAIAIFDVEVQSASQLQKVCGLLESKRGVISVDRSKS